MCVVFVVGVTVIDLIGVSGGGGGGGGGSSSSNKFEFIRITPWPVLRLQMGEMAPDVYF